MDGRVFDSLLRSLTGSRRSLLGGSLAAIGGLLGITTTEAKKKNKKKPCKKKCQDGCCTKKYGKCIRAAQQTPTQCGTGGEICHQCGSGACGECESCCDGSVCRDDVGVDDEHCGVGGVACVPCAENERCTGTCCRVKGAACTGGGTSCCFGLACQEETCCVSNTHSCTQTSDCCHEDDICENGECRRKEGASCEPGTTLCETPLDCNPTTLLCSECPEGQQLCGGSCCEGSCCGTTCCHEFRCCQDLNVCCLPGEGNCCS